MRVLTSLWLAVCVAACTPAPVKQPIAFNHRLHTVDNDLSCDACHPHYAREAFSGRPVVSICMGCHEEAVTESKEEEKIRAYAKKGEEIPWQRLYKMPKHVRYSHARHVTGAKIECKVCHGAIAETTAPPAQPMVQLTMTFCVQCHWSRSVSTDCILCHR